MVILCKIIIINININNIFFIMHFNFDILINIFNYTFDIYNIISFILCLSILYNEYLKYKINNYTKIFLFSFISLISLLLIYFYPLKTYNILKIILQIYKIFHIIFLSINLTSIIKYKFYDKKSYISNNNIFNNNDNNKLKIE